MVIHDINNTWLYMAYIWQLVTAKQNFQGDFVKDNFLSSTLCLSQIIALVKCQCQYYAVLTN